MAGTIQFATRDLDDALASFESALRRNDRYCVAFRGIAAVQAELGHLEEAREAALRGRIEPGVPALARALHVLGPYADLAMVARWREALVQTGAFSLRAARA